MAGGSINLDLNMLDSRGEIVILLIVLSEG